MFQFSAVALDRTAAGRDGGKAQTDVFARVKENKGEKSLTEEKRKAAARRFRRVRARCRVVTGEIGRASGARRGFGGRVPFSPTFESARLLIPASRKRLDLRRVGRSRRGGSAESSAVTLHRCESSVQRWEGLGVEGGVERT